MVYSVKGAQVARIEEGQAGISGILWCPDSLQLLIFSEFLYKCSIYNLLDKSVSTIRSPKLSNSKGCCFSNNCKMMALLEKHDCKDVIGLYFCGDWKLMNSIAIDSFDLT